MTENSPVCLSDLGASEQWRADSDEGMGALPSASRPSVPTEQTASGDETWDSIKAWQLATFGPCALDRLAERANEEMQELLADPFDVVEAADVCIVLAGYPEIREAINSKMAKNRTRQWRVTDDGCGYHVESSPSPVLGRNEAKRSHPNPSQYPEPVKDQAEQGVEEQPRMLVYFLGNGTVPEDFAEALNGYITGGSGRCLEALEAAGAMVLQRRPDAAPDAPLGDQT